jgi:hypothetical protein
MCIKEQAEKLQVELSHLVIYSEAHGIDLEAEGEGFELTIIRFSKNIQK